MRKIYGSKSIAAALFLMLVATFNTYALNYTITFTGSGASTTVESVIVQNLTKGTTVTVPAGNVLNLTDVTTSIDKLNATAEGISISPNPMKESATVSFFAKQDGLASISVYSLDGRKIIGTNANLLQGNNSFRLSLPKGVYMIQIKGNGYSYNAKAVCEASSSIKPLITVYSGQVSSKLQKTKGTVTTMLYSSGDQLLYKGKSGNYTTIVTDKPNSDKTTNFEFVECKDADGNYYAVVKIGNQTWMAENLRTTKYYDGTTIPNIADDNTWILLGTGACCDYNNMSNNSTIYGKLYNWYAATDSRNIAPVGWHVPTEVEWLDLLTFLGGSVATNKLKEAGTAHWQSPNSSATNESGFSALPGSFRYSDGSFGPSYKWACWWSSYDMGNGGAWSMTLNCYTDGTFVSDLLNQREGFSVRCVKN